MRFHNPQDKVVAGKGRSIYMEGDTAGVELHGMFVDAQWIAPDGKVWSIAMGRDVFVRWVRDGFLLACNDCYRKHRVTVCGHIEFPVEFMSKAQHIAKIIRMDLT